MRPTSPQLPLMTPWMAHPHSQELAAMSAVLGEQPAVSRLIQQDLEAACPKNPATGRSGLNVLTLLDSWERLAENVQAYRSARAEAGLDPAAGTVTVGLHTFVGDDEEEVRRVVHHPVRSYLSSFVTQKRNDAAVDGTSSTMSDSEQKALVDEAFE